MSLEAGRWDASQPLIPMLTAKIRYARYRFEDRSEPLISNVGGSSLNVDH
jgi:hypothetical protein